jgi:hypothetical protein
LLIADTTAWYAGLALGVGVVVVAVIIVVTIILLAARIDGEAIRGQTDGLGRIGRINESGTRILQAARAIRKAAVGK